MTRPLPLLAAALGLSLGLLTASLAGLRLGLAQG